MRLGAGSGGTLLWSLAWRFLRGRRTRLLSGTARAALVATTVGVTAMVIAMALMSGYRQELQQKLIRGNAAIIAYPLLSGGGEIDGERMERLLALPGVRQVRRVLYGQGSLATGAEPEGIGVTLRGLDGTEGLEDLGALELHGEPAPVGEGALPWVVAGSELIDRLELEPEAPVRLMVLGLEGGRPRFRYRSARLLGGFTTGFSEFDESWVVVDRSLLERLQSAGTGLEVYEIATGDAAGAPVIADRVREVLGEGFLVTDWRELNRELFTALEVQQIALFFVLGLIVLVSTFNVASSLVVLVRERMRDIGLLAALGLAPRQLRTLFLIYSAGLGLAGGLGGVGLGAAVSWLLTEYELVRFTPEVAAIYFISSVPFRVRLLDVGAVLAFTLGVTLLACWLPARRAGRVRPAAALRYE